MDFSLNEEQKQIKALVREFCRREVDQKRMAEILRKNDTAKTIEEIRANYPYDLEEKAHKAGLKTIGIPTKYGGPGPDTEPNMALAVALEEEGYSGGIVIEDFDLLIGPGFQDQALRKNPYVTEKEREERFSRLLKYTGQHGGGTLSEPAGATDIHLGYDEGGSRILQVTARKDGDGWILNGDKMFSSGGAVADFVTVFARTKEGPISESASWFHVPVNTPGVTRNLNKLIFTGIKGNVQFHYDNVRLPEDALQGKLHMGYKDMAYQFQYKWSTHSYLGWAQRVYEDMRDYAKQRIGGGKPIIQHTSVAEKLGDLALRLEALRALWYKAAYETDQMEKSGAPCPPKSNWYWDQVYLIFVKQTCYRICEVGHEIYGSIILSDDLPVESFLRYTYLRRAGTLPINMGLMRICWDYDTRYYYQT